MNLTETDKKCILFLRNHAGCFIGRPSDIGYGVFNRSKKSPQGMALCGGSAMRRLKNKGLISIEFSEDKRTVYKIKEDQMKSLKQHVRELSNQESRAAIFAALSDKPREHPFWKNQWMFTYDVFLNESRQMNQPDEFWFWVSLQPKDLVIYILRSV